MFKQTIEYMDYNGVSRKEDFYFHLSLPEVTRLEVEFGADIATYATKAAEEGDVKKLLDFLERMILTSYGKKTSDGRSFYKSDELRKEFEYSQAYAELFEQMLKNPDLARKFGESVAGNVKAQKNQVEPIVVSE